jgi:hypothetical protein
MSTGIETWGDPAQTGALWPFAGTVATILVVIGIVAWIVWHVVQVRGENKEYDDAVDLYEQIGLERVMHPDGLAKVEQAMDRMNHQQETPTSTGE